MARDQRSKRPAGGDAARAPLADAPAELEGAAQDPASVEVTDPEATDVDLEIIEDGLGDPDPASPSPAPKAAGHAKDGLTSSSATVHPMGTRPWGILCRIKGPGSVAGHGIRLDGRVAHFWEAGSRGYFSQASIDKLPTLLVPEPD
jgi:hypothetical protein